MARNKRGGLVVRENLRLPYVALYTKFKRKRTKERTYHTEDTKRRAIEAHCNNPTRPKSAIAKEFGVAPSTFSMWLSKRETDNRLPGEFIGSTVFNSDETFTIKITDEIELLTQIRDELKSLNQYIREEEG